VLGGLHVVASAARGQAPQGRAAAAPRAGQTAAEGETADPLKAVESDATSCRTAAEAAQVYKIFLADLTLPSAQRQAAEERLKHWQQLADERRRRMGKKWLTPDEYEAVEKKTEQFLAHGVELLRLGNQKLARDEFVAASRLNPENGRADFVMGLIYSLLANNDAKAVEHFTEVIEREPNNGFAFNNLAVSELLTRRYASAARHFRRALEIMPDSQDAADNIAVAIGMSARATRHRLPDKIADELNDLYRTAIHELRLKPYDDSRFATSANETGGRPPGIWAYTLMSPLGRTWNDRAEKEGGIQGLLEEPEEAVVGIASGTGFVVAPGCVVTNRHVIEGATDLVILDPEDREKQYVATVVASSEDPDIAILKCEQLQAPPLPLADKLPRRGSDIMALGFPGGSQLGMELKSTRGAVITAGDPDLDGGNFLHSATVNPGNSGGPIVDQAGRVVGVVVAIMRSNLVGNAYSVGIPIERAWPFLKEHLDNVQPNLDGDGTLDWPDVDERTSPSTVFIYAKTKRPGKKRVAADPAGGASPPPQAPPQAPDVPSPAPPPPPPEEAPATPPAPDPTPADAQPGQPTPDAATTSPPA
jgi:S1-C subfamily serine protease